MDIRTRICFEISRRQMKPPMRRTEDVSVYEQWRHESLSKSWNHFSDDHVDGKEVVDFGCGDGQLAFYLVFEKQPKRMVGVDLSETAIERARQRQSEREVAPAVLEFLNSGKDRLPLDKESFDTLLAFDCMEHVMAPEAILNDWHRVLRPGGRCLIVWFPFKGPWGPHMESLIPIPWAPVIFGERALFRAAEKIYDLPEFTPRHWDLDETGTKKPNKWRAWSSFEEQGYINELGLGEFKRLAIEAGFTVDRFECHSFEGAAWRRNLGKVLMNTPIIWEYFVSFVLVELIKN